MAGQFDGDATGLSEQPVYGDGSIDAGNPAQQPVQTRHGNLFVKGLPLDLDESGLSMMFSNFGIVDTCRIIRNGRTMTSKGYGFIKFADPDQAEAAINGVNGQQLGQGLLEVKHADADAGSRSQGRTPSDNLYIRGLPPAWTDEDLANLFAPYGGVQECRMLHPRGPPGVDLTGQSAGGLVRLGSVDAAAAAISGLNDRPPLTGPGGPPLLVRFADTPEEKQRKAARKERYAWRGMTGPGGMPAGFTAFNGDMPDGQQLYQQSATTQTYASGGGAAVGSYSGYGGARGDYGNYPGSGPAGYGAAVSPGRGMSASLYIKNLPPTADKLFLYEHFAPLGAILSVRVLTEESGACRGVGFVNYQDARAAAAAAAMMHGARLGEKPLHVSIQPVKQRPPRPAGMPAMGPGPQIAGGMQPLQQQPLQQ